MGATRGGGAGRLRAGIRTQDDLCRDAKRSCADYYIQAYAQTEAALKRHLKHYARRLGATSSEDYADRLRAAFRGKRWQSTKDRVAAIMYRANSAALETINDSAPDAISEGANQQAFYLYVQRPDYDPLPYTASVIIALIAAGLIAYTRKTVNREKDADYVRQRLQSITNAEIDADGNIETIARRIARRLVNSQRDLMYDTADDLITGAYDTGIYTAAQDADRHGLDVEKTWLGIPDNRIRASHYHLHGKTLPLNGIFIGFHGRLRYPHDPTAPPAETRRCRCRLAVHLAGRAPIPYNGKLLTPSQVPSYLKWRENAIRTGADDLLQAHLRRRHSRAEH